MSDLETKNHPLSESSHPQDENPSLAFNEEESAFCPPTEEIVHENELDEEAESSTESSKHKKPNPHLEVFNKEISELSSAEAKLKYALTFMENSLAQNSGIPHFKTFWEVRGVCLQLFKENLPPTARTQLWAKYSELSKEARRLKELLDEQSSFAAEQIEIAIKALEDDITHFNESLGKLSNPELGQLPKMFSKKTSFYQDLQKRLNLLNVQASRINALRKELIKTEMRVRLKNKFFQRLSVAGDQIFPLRKDLIKEVSTVFSEDVDAFIHANFNEDFQDSLFVLREEIKCLQNLAKLLTLNTQAFTHTRMRLSECWDKIKFAEKERKKERAQLRSVFKQNYDEVSSRIEDLKQKYETNQLSDDQVHQQIDEISRFMRGVELGRDEIKALKDALFSLKNKLAEKVKAQEQVRLQHEQEKEKQRKEKIDEFKEHIDVLGAKIRQMDVQELAAARDELLNKFQAITLNKFERQEIERLLKPLRSSITDALTDKEEQALLSLSENDRQSIEQLKEVLKQRKDRRTEIKNQLETLRKAAGTSGLDFEKAMNHNELIQSERERLEKINLGIKEIEDKIVQLQKKK